MSYAELYRRREELVGSSVDVTGKVFFLSRCPPPGEAGASDCYLTGYFTDPSQGDLHESDRGKAITLAEGGQLLTCKESTATEGACPGWRHAVRFRVVGEVQHQVLGGRSTQYVQLDVTTKHVV